MVTEPEELVVEETEQTDVEEPQHIRYEITAYPSDFTVQVMKDKMRAGQIVIPPFQRGYVWTRPQASRLIESFLLGLPVPQIFLYRESRSGELLVIDGHQRLGTIERFYKGRFAENQVFHLTGIDSRWNGKTYDELSTADQRQMDDTTLRSIVVQQLHPDDRTSTYQIFERLNTGGTQLSPMEIRKAIHQGPALRLLERLNALPEWQALLGRDRPDKRLRDVELVLRIVALHMDAERYSKPMKQFLTLHLASMDRSSPKDLQGIDNGFTRACRAAANLGTKPFHLRGPLNVAAIDSVLATLMTAPDPLSISDLSNRYETLRHDEDWASAAALNTSDVSVVKQRFERTAKILLEG